MVVIDIKGAASLDREVEKAKIEVVRVLFNALAGLSKPFERF